MNQTNYVGGSLGIVERNTLLDQVDLQNIFDDWSKKQRISISVVVRPTSPTSSFFDVYELMAGGWVCGGGKQFCLTQIMTDYGIRRYEENNY